MQPKPRVIRVDEAGVWWYDAAQIIRVKDGDTAIVQAYVDVGFDKWDVIVFTVRLLGIDAPDVDRKELKAQATAHAQELFPVGLAVKIGSRDYDKYGGRTDGYIRRADSDLDWSQAMLGWYGTVAYNGGKRGMQG